MDERIYSEKERRSLTKRWSEYPCLSQIMLTHALRQPWSSLIFDVRQKSMNTRKTQLIGLLSILSGALLRSVSYRLAWPSSYSYSGRREATICAFLENLYANLGLALLIFGAVALALSVTSSQGNDQK